LSTQAFCPWRAKPVPDRDHDDAYLIDAAFDVHSDDPEFGYRGAALMRTAPVVALVLT